MEDSCGDKAPESDHNGRVSRDDLAVGFLGPLPAPQLPNQEMEQRGKAGGGGVKTLQRPQDKHMRKIQDLLNGTSSKSRQTPPPSVPEMTSLHHAWEAMMRMMMATMMMAMLALVRRAYFLVDAKGQQTLVLMAEAPQPSSEDTIKHNTHPPHYVKK